MRTAVIYFIFGGLFTYLAIKSVDETIWNFMTLLFALVATVDFGIAIRFLRVYFQSKQDK